MSNAIFPAAVRGLTYTVTKTPSFKTIVQTAPNEASLRISQIRNPIWSFQLIYEFLTDNQNDILPAFGYSDLRAMMGFFLQRSGQQDDFLLLDPDDNTAGDPTPTNVIPHVIPTVTLPLVTDGLGNYYSPLQRTIGGFLEDVTDLVPNTLFVFAAGSPMTNGVNYTLLGPGLAVAGNSYVGLYLKWLVVPSTPITAQFNFYFRVRFNTDKQDFEKFIGQFWTVGGPDAQNSEALKMVTARPAPAF